MTTSPALNSSTVVSTTVPAMVPLVSEIRNALKAPRVGVTARIYTNRDGSTESSVRPARMSRFDPGLLPLSSPKFLALGAASIIRTSRFSA